MANQITETGLELLTTNELITQYTDGMKVIYGSDINLEQDTPDGQQMMLIVQMISDNLDLIRSVYNSFDPDNAFGVTLDKRIAYNGIQRLGGTFTLTNITIVSDRALTLKGYNVVGEDDAYRVSDDAGTEWILIDDLIFVSASTSVGSFRAVNAGEVLTTINTITTPVSIILGIDSVNNPTALSVLGINEESDNEAKIRRSISVSRASQGYLPSLRAELENINDVGSVKTYENNTSAVDINGVTPHSIWIIVSGTASNAEIASAIYRKRSAGCNMFGTINYDYTEVDGKIFVVTWDTVIPEDLYIEFTVQSQDGINPPLDSEILAGLPALLTYGIGDSANTNDIVDAIRSIDPNSFVTLTGLSLSGGGPFIGIQAPTTLRNQLAVASARIDITVI